MIALTIDGRGVDVPAGSTILGAARKLGIEIPTLCFLEGLPPQTTCMVCVVRVRGVKRMMPACSTRVVDGMVVESESDAVRAERKRAVELLLGDHTGDCVALCESACPVHWPIPRFLRLLGAGDSVGAARLAGEWLILPRILGAVCPAPCEGACRRKPAGGAVAMARLHAGLAACESPTDVVGQAGTASAAVIGGGPAGMAAAVTLARRGVRVELFEKEDALGGGLRGEWAAGRIPHEDWDTDLAILEQLGVVVRLGQSVDDADAVNRVCGAFDVVLQATGAGDGGSKMTAGDKPVADSRAAVFRVPAAASRRPMAVRAVAAGRSVALEALAHLAGRGGKHDRPTLSTRYGKLDAEALAPLLALARQADRAVGEQGLSGVTANEEAARCLHCDCRKADSCRLRQTAVSLDARPSALPGAHAPVTLDTSHPDVIFEPGKCIKCGICVALTGQSEQASGLAFVNRGFCVAVESPFERPLSDALGDQAAACVEQCPTGALAWRDLTRV